MPFPTRTVQVNDISDLASEREIREFFSFSGDIDHIEIRRDGQSKTAFVTFNDPKALEIALLLSLQELESLLAANEEGKAILQLQNITKNPVNIVYYGATIVDKIVRISPVENYVPKCDTHEVRMVENAVFLSPAGDLSSSVENNPSPQGSGRIYVNKAQDVVASVIAKGSAIGQDAMNKAKAFDEKHKLSASASAKVISFDRRVGITEKWSVGISAVNEKVKSVDQRLHVSDKTMAAIFAAERKLNDTGSAVKTSKYVTTGSAWLNGAFTRVAKAGQVAGSKTKEKFHSAVLNLTRKEHPIVA